MTTRRAFLLSTAAFTALPSTGHAVPALPDRAEAFPLEAVSLAPSIWRTAVESNVRYLKTLEPDRLLHNFHRSAGLPPKGEVYGGWESMGIAGHTLGHYLSACALAFAQTRDPALAGQVRYTVAELARIQAAHGDGYVGGTTVERDGRTVDGKVVFEEIRQGRITSHGFDLNGGWVPIYTWHKVHAGLLDAHRYTGDAEALKVAVGLSDYLIGVLGGLSDAQLQQVLAAEHGGINETFAETYARTGQRRFLDMAERLYHRAVLAPLAEGRDELEGKHANTQIPKVIGLARLHELTGKPGYARTARFFWDRVTNHHSFVIGGNSTGEHFGPAGRLAGRIDDKTCEACNSYNMLKLTRHLYGWQPRAAWFDAYERTHLNHIMAHQDPATGAFVYFMPLSAGSQRLYSTPTDSFWCCVGSGMESHAKHGDSIYWRSGETVLVNLFIPSRLTWTERRTTIDLSGDILKAEPVVLTVTPEQPTTFTLAVRLPAWAERPSLTVNGAEHPMETADGYVRLRRRWRAGDRVELTLPHRLRVETVADDPRLAAFVKGPMVLAADLGPAGGEAPAPVALVGAEPLAALDAASLTLAAQPAPVRMRPFFNQHGRRSTVYLPLFTPAEWRVQAQAWKAEQAARAGLAARTIDVLRLGEMQPERDHAFSTDIAEVASRLGRSGRWLMWTNDRHMAFDLAVDPAGTVLQVTYWGQDTGKNFDIGVDGVLLATETLAAPSQVGFRTIDYPLRPELVRGKARANVRFTTRNSDLAVFEVRTLRPSPSQPDRARQDGRAPP